MASSRYPIPADTARVELRIVNSRFVATAGEARTAADARAFIDLVRDEFSDATHNVYAFRAGYGASVTEGMSDAGEPSGTAGRPALSVLRGADLGDIVVVITRYFGGTKLGTGGLVRAYTQSTQEVLAALRRSERVQQQRGVLTVPYRLYERVKLALTELGGVIEHEEFAADVVLTTVLSIDAIDAFDATIQELSAGQIEIAWGETFD